MTSHREFDIVLLGPTGYTGKFCAGHIVQHLPTDLKWALAGRSLQKVERLATELKSLNPDRVPPEVLAVQLTREELDPLVQRTKVLINTVGPYHIHSTPVVEACAVNGTHYVDATGETPWVIPMVELYHDIAKDNGAIMIHCAGVESAPADILTWSLVKRVHDEFSSPVREVTCCLSDRKSSGPSGGTLSTILTMLDTLPLPKILLSTNPFSLAVSPPPRDIPDSTLSEKIWGTRPVRDLGVLTTSPMAAADTAIVHRSSTLMPALYGRRFYFREFLRVRNVLVGVLVHLGLVALFLLLLTRPFRSLVKKVVYAPGTGPRLEDSVNDYLEYLAVATEDVSGRGRGDVSGPPKRVLGRFKCQATMYQLTGLLLAEAALVIVKQQEEVRKVSGGGGIVTPATLGQAFVDRLEQAGCGIETKVIEN